MNPTEFKITVLTQLVQALASEFRAKADVLDRVLVEAQGIPEAPPAQDMTALLSAVRARNPALADKSDAELLTMFGGKS